MIGKLGVEYKLTGTKGKRFALGSERVQTHPSRRRTQLRRLSSELWLVLYKN
jgi:hypothetical protein